MSPKCLGARLQVPGAGAREYVLSTLEKEAAAREREYGLSTAQEKTQGSAPSELSIAMTCMSDSLCHLEAWVAQISDQLSPLLTAQKVQECSTPSEPGFAGSAPAINFIMQLNDRIKVINNSLADVSHRLVI